MDRRCAKLAAPLQDLPMGQYVKIIIAASVHLVRSPLQNFVPRALAIFSLPYPGVRPNAAREGARTETGCRDAQEPREPGGVDEFTQQMEAWQRGPEVGEERAGGRFEQRVADFEGEFVFRKLPEKAEGQPGQREKRGRVFRTPAFGTGTQARGTAGRGGADELVTLWLVLKYGRNKPKIA